MIQTFITWNVKKHIQNSGLVEQTSNLRDTHSKSLRPAWSTQQIPAQQWLHDDNFYQNTKNKNIYKCKMSAEKNIFSKSKISHRTERTLWKDEQL